MTPSFNIRRGAPGDEPILDLLSREDADFDIDGRGGAEDTLLGDADARAFLSDPAVLLWIAEAGGAVIGFTYAHVLRLRHGDPRELLLYEIGVRKAHRRRGVGRALLDAVHAWMRAHDVPEIWVGADNPGARAFYQACGYAPTAGGATFMQRRV